MVEEQIQEKPVIKKGTPHWWAIHAKVAHYVWGGLDDKTRDIIVNDIGNNSYALKNFQRYVDSETERLFLDDQYYFNNPRTFRGKRVVKKK